MLLVVRTYGFIAFRNFRFGSVGSPMLYTSDKLAGTSSDVFTVGISYC